MRRRMRDRAGQTAVNSGGIRDQADVFPGIKSRLSRARTSMPGLDPGPTAEAETAVVSGAGPKNRFGRQAESQRPATGAPRRRPPKEPSLALFIFSETADAYTGGGQNDPQENEENRINQRPENRTGHRGKEMPVEPDDGIHGRAAVRNPDHEQDFSPAGSTRQRPRSD